MYSMLFRGLKRRDVLITTSSYYYRGESFYAYVLISDFHCRLTITSVSMFSTTGLFYPVAEDYGPYVLLAVAATLLLAQFVVAHRKASCHQTCKTMKPGLHPRERLIDKTIIQARSWTDTSRSIEVENKRQGVYGVLKRVSDRFVTDIICMAALFPGRGYGGRHHSILQLALQDKTTRTPFEACLVGYARTLSQPWRYIPSCSGYARVLSHVVEH